MARTEKKQSGMVLILAILIIASVLATAVVFSNLIISEIRQSRLIDQSIQSYYLAESGAERALYETRRKEAVKPEDCSKIQSGSTCQITGYCSLTTPSNSVPCISLNEGNLSGLPGQWDIAVTNEKQVSIFLNIGESFQIDLFNPYQVAGFEVGMESFEITGTPGSTLAAELSNVTWLVGGTLDCNPNVFTPPEPAITRGDIIINSSGSSTYLVNVYSGDPSINPNCSYILRVSNSILPDAAAGQFNLSIFNKATDVDPISNRLDIPSRLIINSQADFGSSHQELKVRTPIRPPLSGLYDFVIFSEEEIVK
ncbi:MAG: hypothetical protein HUU49_02720 [Candidatus Buchananbacteria bacterium]|nr:hypothetical protein [Candidatus Buchananbacteria bacterium]